MNVNSTSSNEKVKETNTQSQVKQQEKDEQTSFSEEYQQLLAQNNGLNLSYAEENQLLAMMKNNNVANSFTTKAGDIRSSFNYDTMTISKDDALFFSELVEKTEFAVKESGEQGAFQLALVKAVSESDTETLKPAEVSKSLMNLIESAYKTQKPTRIDFDNNVSVILRIGRDGKVSAEFIPGDKAVEQYLRDNIGFLKSNLEEKNIDYGDIMYKPYKDNSKQQRDNRNNGGNK